MKKFFLLVTLMGAWCLGYGQVYSYHFQKPQIVTDDKGYSEIVFGECYNMAPEGAPLLPLYGADLLLPQGHEISDVIVRSITYSGLIEGIRMVPAGKQVPVSKGPGPDWKLTPDEKIYSLPGPYPGKNISQVSTGFLAGHSIGTFAICPMVYYPESNKIKFITDITVEVVTAPSAEAKAAEAMLKNSALIRDRIENIVENPGLLKSYAYPQQKSTDDVDILLITKNSLLADFNTYVSFKESTGYIVETITTETIYSQYTGQDNQDKIRNCIKDFYDNHNLLFVILGGDADPNSSTDNIIPHRGFYAVDDDDIPADMYYCCLDGNWNTDGDNRWGEAGETDLYAEVGVGRLCVDGSTEITNFTNKLKKYQDEPVVADIKKALMLGEELNNNPPTYGDTYKEEIVNGCSLHGFTTVAMPQDYLYTKLYDSQGGWSKTQVFQAFNTTGVNLLNHLGHSYVDYNMKMYNSDVTSSNFTNNGTTRGYAIGYSQGCYNGSFDNRDDGGGYMSDCFAEKITTITTAQVASIANSRYGWYAPGNTNSSSQFHDRQFFDAIYGEDITQIGTVNSDAKEDNGTYFNGDPYIRWTVYETNLFGDPSMDIWTDTPTNIDADYLAGVPIGSTEIPFNTDAPGARIGLVQNGVLIGRAVADASGDATVELFDAISVSDPVSVSVIAHNRHRHQGSILVLTNQPFVLFNSYQVHDNSGNNNGQVDFGESIMLGLGVKNVGNQPATGVVVTLSTQDAYCTITDATETYGNLAAGEIKFIDNSFAFTVSGMIPDQHGITFLLTATGDSTWTSNFTITANAPAFTLGGLNISDPTGNNNGRLDPGETADITIFTTNSGHCDAIATTGSITLAGSYITINSSIHNFGTLAAGQTAQASFSITADASAPMGSMSGLVYEVTSGDYSKEEIYYVKIGLIVEDFESGNFSQFNWSTNGHQPWSVVAAGSWEGSHCAKSGDINDNQYSMLMLPYEVSTNDSISFYYKVSSEESYDYLIFYIDGTVAGQWAGEVPWTRASFPVSAGNHSFKWMYDKDTYVTSGSDCAWIDFVVLPTPLMTTAYAGPDALICEGSNHACQGAATNFTTVSWTTSGSGTFSNGQVLDPTYYPSAGDILAGSLVLTMNVYGGQGNLTDNLTLTITRKPSISMETDLSICAGDEFAFSNNTVQDYLSLLWTTSGDGTFNDNTTLNPVYTPGNGDIASGQVTLTLTAGALAPCGDVSQDADLIIHDLPVINLGNDTSVCSNLTVTLDAGPWGTSYLWSTGEITQTIIANSGGTPGAVNYSVLVTDAQGCQGTDDITITFEDCSGIAGNQAGRFTLYPNPSAGRFVLDAGEGAPAITELRITNSMGAVFFILKNNPALVSGRTTVDLGGVAPGIYFLHIVTGQGDTIMKVVIR